MTSNTRRASALLLFSTGCPGRGPEVIADAGWRVDFNEMCAGDAALLFAGEDVRDCGTWSTSFDGNPALFSQAQCALDARDAGAPFILQISQSDIDTGRVDVFVRNNAGESRDYSQNWMAPGGFMPTVWIPCSRFFGPFWPGSSGPPEYLVCIAPVNVLPRTVCP